MMISHSQQQRSINEMITRTSTSCPGFLDQYGVWNNGFDCSSPRLCCGTENERFCCLPSTSSSPSIDDESFLVDSTTNFLPDRWFFFQIGLAGFCLAITILIIVAIYQCLTSLHQRKERRDKFVASRQNSLPIDENRRINSNRISTISSSTSSDMKSRCTDTSFVLQTSLNLYPHQSTSNTSSRNSSASFYIFPNDFDRLCQS